MPVLMPAAVDVAFDYLLPPATPVGALVEATLAGKQRIGVVWAAQSSSDVAASKIKPVGRVLELPPLKQSFRDWLEWMANYTLAPLGAVVSLAALRYAAKLPKKPYVTPEYKPALPVLTDEQQRALAVLKTEKTKPILLDGVTGSGKTEVYFHAIAEILARGGQVVVLVPEIALTHQWISRFVQGFGQKPALWHSKTTPAQRQKTWHGVLSGDVRIVVGARSALFLPFCDLQMIVIDEEHDPSYKQDDGVLYHARDMAVARANFEKIPVVLVSATPSLETLLNVEAHKYHAIHLQKRYGKAGLPRVQVIDLLLDKREAGDFLSPTVKAELLATLARGEQSLMFLNRRGYAPLLLCRACGHRFECADCSAWLVLHGRNRLQCHHCGHGEPVPPACPSCAAPREKLAACGPGVERIAEEVKALFASGDGVQREAPTIAILSSDEAVAAETWEQIERGAIDIVIGTQMAAKGHHFPTLTFVAVVDADVGLEGADLRSAERTYQLLHQLGGRAGRADKPGMVFIQTYQANHPVIGALVRHDRDAVMALEAQMRREGNWPPFGNLAAILLDGPDEQAVKRAGQALARSAPQDARIRVLGPAPAPLSKLRGQYRYRLLVKMGEGIHPQRTLKAWLAGKKFAGVRLKLDVNPYDFQ
jgi:primosomal protein N' (replication factor Y)